jgi:hypothetical protein
MLERLVSEAISITKWDEKGSPGWDLSQYNLRFIWLAKKVMSISGADIELHRLKSSRITRVFELAIESLRKEIKSDADSIIEAIDFQLDAIRGEPIRKYLVAVPVALSLDTGSARETFHIDGRSAVLHGYWDFANQYLPRKTQQGQQEFDISPFEGHGFDLVSAAMETPTFLVLEIYARDSWQAMLESEVCLDFLLSVADLFGPRNVFESYPLSLFPNPTLCFVFLDPQTKPEVFGHWTREDRLSKFLFEWSSFLKTLSLLSPLEGNDIWPILRASLAAFRRAMVQTNPSDSLVHLWTACEVITKMGDQMNDEKMAQRMKGIFRNAWYEFPLQIDAFLDLRNKALHDADYAAQWHHIVFCRFLFENLVSILIGYSQKGKCSADIRSSFEAAKMTEEERRAMLGVLQEYKQP